MLIIDKLVQANYFSKSEEVIANFIIDLGEKIEHFSAREIAKETFTSPATVLNLCKKIDISGFNNFKEQYLKEIRYLNNKFDSVDVNAPFDINDSTSVIVNKIGSLYIDAIKDTQSLIDNLDLEKSIKKISESNSIHIYSYGTALNIAESFREKMIKIGKAVHITNNLNYQKYELNTITKNDFVIFLSYSGETRSIIDMAKTCVYRQIPFLTVTSYGNNTLSDLSELNLYISTREKLNKNIANYSSNLSISYILDLIYSCYFALDYEKNYRYKLEAIKKHENNRSSSNKILNLNEEN